MLINAVLGAVVVRAIGALVVRPGGACPTFDFECFEDTSWKTPSLAMTSALSEREAEV